MIDGVLQHALDGGILGGEKRKFINDQNDAFLCLRLTADASERFFPVGERRKEIASEKSLHGFGKIMQVQ